MKAYDFQYGKRTLSSFGMMICSFDSKGLETIDGIEITFNTVSTLNGAKSELISTIYEQNLETTIQIAKYSCSTGIQEISSHEYREILRWLSRKGFYKLKFLGKDHIDLYYEAAFTKIRKIEIDGKLYGLELTIQTNRPFALKEPRIITINNTAENIANNKKHSVFDTSNEEGCIYPCTEIKILEDGDLDIYNALEDRHVVIKNCVANEVITMDYPIIQSSISSHKIQNDFNWNFFRIANTYENRRNDLTISLPCTIKIEYSPIIKVGL